jgi:hypothetical protein
VPSVGLGYGRQLYFQCLLKYMIICAFDSPSSIPSFLATQIVYIRYGQFKKKDSFSFYLSIAVLLVLLYLIAANKSVLLLYACAHKISLKYLIEKNSIERCCQKCQECNTFCVTNFFPLNFKGLSNKKY